MKVAFFMVIGWIGLVQAQQFSVVVSSYGESGSLSKSTPLCFDQAAEMKSAPNFKEKAVRKDIIGMCTQIGRIKGVNISEKRRPGCYPIRISWGLVKEKKENHRASWCSFRSGLCLHGPRTYRDWFGKELVLKIHNQKDAQIHEMQAIMSSENRGFNPATAEVLCRGMWQEFPQKRTNAKYRAAPVVTSSK